jgi:RHS repeat-associated protein
MTSQTVNGSTTSYSYDAANELTADGATNYTYDLNGNRTGGSYTTGAANQLTSDGTWTYSYDNEGNLTKRTKGASAETWTYGYDNLNHMVWAKDSATDGGTVTTLATYVYDAFGNRLEEDVWAQPSGTTTVTRFAYDMYSPGGGHCCSQTSQSAGEVWADLTSSNALQTRYLRGDQVDQLFARISSSGTAAWYLTDWHGSVTNLTDNSGNVQDTIAYDAFGNVTSESNPSFGDRYKYTGRELDAATGFQYNRARYYYAAIGRWTSQDPLGFKGGDANFYCYVHNAATNLQDPTGLRVGLTASQCWDQYYKYLAEIDADPELSDRAKKLRKSRAGNMLNDCLERVPSPVPPLPRVVPTIVPIINTGLIGANVFMTTVILVTLIPGPGWVAGAVLITSYAAGIMVVTKLDVVPYTAYAPEPPVGSHRLPSVPGVAAGKVT